MGPLPHDFAHVSPPGPFRYDQIPCFIGVLESPDKPMPIGEAYCETCDRERPCDLDAPDR